MDEAIIQTNGNKKNKAIKVIKTVVQIRWNLFLVIFLRSPFNLSLNDREEDNDDTVDDTHRGGQAQLSVRKASPVNVVDWRHRCVVRPTLGHDHGLGHQVQSRNQGRRHNHHRRWPQRRHGNVAEALPGIGSI